MNIFSVRAWGNWGGGVAFVAANTEDEARALAAEIVDPTWKTNYRKPSEVAEVATDVLNLKPGVIDHFETGE